MKAIEPGEWAHLVGGAAVFDALPFAAALLDRTGRIVCTNHAWNAIASEHGRGLSDLGANYPELCEQVQMPHLAQGIWTVLAGSKTEFSSLYECDIDGAVSHFRLHATMCGEGALISHIEVISSAEAILALNDALEAGHHDRRREPEADEAIAAIIELSQAPVVSVDKEGVIVLFNSGAEKAFGYDRHEVLGRPLDLLVPHRFRGIHTKHLAAFFAQTEPTRTFRFQMTGLRKDGTEFPADSGLSLATFRGRPLATTILHDNSEAEKQSNSNKLEAIGRLAAGIAHEINTPIQYIGDNVRFVGEAIEEMCPILGQVAMLGTLDPGSPEFARVVGLIQEAIGQVDFGFYQDEVPRACEQSIEGVNRVASIVRAMKDFSHPGGTDKVPSNLNQAIESTSVVSRNEYKYVADLVLDLDSNLPLVPCHIQDIKQVMLNLIVNAAHAIADRNEKQPMQAGLIEISTSADDTSVTIIVRDNGCGIPSENASRIFEPFFTTKEVGRGTGQGLALAYGVIAKAHGGEITMESEVGRGTAFTIRLPLVEQGFLEEAA